MRGSASRISPTIHVAAANRCAEVPRYQGAVSGNHTLLVRREWTTLYCALSGLMSSGELFGLSHGFHAFSLFALLVE
jgi:hypothetical protein